MIGYVTLGTDDAPRAATFRDGLMACFGDLDGNRLTAFCMVEVQPDESS